MLMLLGLAASCGKSEKVLGADGRVGAAASALADSTEKRPMGCRFPRSRMVKSSLVRFSTGLFLLRTMTPIWTRRVVTRTGGVCAGFCGDASVGSRTKGIEVQATKKTDLAKSKRRAANASLGKPA